LQEDEQTPEEADVPAVVPTVPSQNEAAVTSSSHGDEFEDAAFAAVKAINARDSAEDLREIFLSYRFLATEPPKCIAEMSAREREGAWQPLSASQGGDRGARASGGGDRRFDRSMFGSKVSNGRDSDRRGDRRDRQDRGDRGDRGDRHERQPKAPVLLQSENAWTVTKASTRPEELSRAGQSLLNKICPENVQTIATRMKAELKVESVSELELVIGLIFKKALLEISYSETYADLVFHLRKEMPEFPSEGGGKPITFKSSLLTICQQEFESMQTEMNKECDGDTDLVKETRQKKIRDRCLANMRFIGNLFLRQLLTAKVIASVLNELTMQDDPNPDKMPEDYVLECICELLTAIGHTLESMPVGKSSLQSVCGRLLDLKNRKSKDGKKVFTKRMQFQIQDLLELRAAGWVKRTFKKQAMTKEDVKAQHERDLKAANTGKKVDEADVVVAGARPACLDKEKDTKEPWQETTKVRKERKA
jgi:hypothetical protein